jgi:hypothetical protein
MKENVVFVGVAWYTYPIKTKQHKPKVRRYNMQGSFGDAQERFRGGKKKDNEQAKFNKKDNEFRNRRRNRHQDAD